MKVSSVTSKVTYTGDGATYVFPIVFSYLEDSEVEVTRHWLSNASTNVLTLNTDYVISSNNVRLTGSYSYLPTGSQLIISRDMSFTQAVDYTSGGPFPAETHEEALDRLTMISQQLKEIFDRMIVRSISYNSALTFPSLVSGGYLTTDGSTLSFDDMVSMTFNYSGTISRGTAAAKPGTPGVGDVYIETDTKKLYTCNSAGNWTCIPDMNSQTTKNPPLATSDIFLIEDSAASNAKKKVVMSSVLKGDEVSLTHSSGQLKILSITGHASAIADGITAQNSSGKLIVGSILRSTSAATMSTAYTAVTDGWVSVQSTYNAAAGGFYIYSDTNAYPSTLVAALFWDAAGNNRIDNLIHPILEGNNWYVLTSAWGGTIKWTPMGR